MDQFASMAAFVKSVDAGSLSAAARALGISQAMVSKHLRALERGLGVRLLNLTTRRLALTEAGAAYYERCVRILDDVADAGREAMQLQAEPSGVLRLTAPLAFGELRLAPAIAEFLLRHPAIRVEAAFGDRFASLVEEGYDVAVRIGRLPDSGLVARRLGATRMLTCAAPRYLERHGTPAHPRELAGHRCLALDSVSTPGVWWYREDGRPLDVAVGGPLRCNSIGAACAAARAGLGIVYGPDFALQPHVADGSLVALLPGFDTAPLDIHALMPGRRHTAAKVRLFIDFLAGRFGAGATSAACAPEQ